MDWALWHSVVLLRILYSCCFNRLKLCLLTTALSSPQLRTVDNIAVQLQRCTSVAGLAGKGEDRCCLSRFLLCPGIGVEYCDQFVCLSVCEHISGTALPIFRKFFVQIPYGYGTVLLWRRCDTLCTSGFMDDVTFCRSGPYGDAWNGWVFNLLPLAALWYRGSDWCLSMPCFVLWALGMAACFTYSRTLGWKS